MPVGAGERERVVGRGVDGAARRAGAHDLRERVPPRQRGFAAHRDVLPHRQAVEQLGALEGAARVPGGPARRRRHG